MLFIKWTNPGINKRLYEILAILKAKGIINAFSSHLFKFKFDGRGWFKSFAHAYFQQSSFQCLLFRHFNLKNFDEVERGDLRIS